MNLRQIFKTFAHRHVPERVEIHPQLQHEGGET